MKIKLIPMSEFKTGKLVRCVGAPDGWEAYIGREGLLYPASEKLHGRSATWMSDCAAEVPVREGEGLLFAAPGSLP